MESIDRLRKYVTGPARCGISHICEKNILKDLDSIEQEHKQVLHDAVNKAHADGERNALRQERSASEDYRRGLEDGKAEGYALAHTTTKQEADAYAEMESFHDRLCRASERREDVTLWGVDYMPLPLDADGVPIHVGDVMEWDNGTFTVHELKVTEDGWTTWDEQHGYTVHVDVCHHHAPTVEDVLREMLVQAVGYSDANTTVALNTIAEYAAKLRLAGDGE